MAAFGRVFKFKRPYLSLGLAISLAGHLLVISAAAQIYRRYYIASQEPLIRVLGTAVFEGGTSVRPISTSRVATQNEHNYFAPIPSKIPEPVEVQRRIIKKIAAVKITKPELNSSLRSISAPVTEIGNGSITQGIEEIDISSAMTHGIRQPNYPTLSRKLGEEGRVVLQVSMLPTGSVVGVKVERSSGYSRLDEAAKEALLASNFSSATPPIRRIAFNFKLK